MKSLFKSFILFVHLLRLNHLKKTASLSKYETTINNNNNKTKTKKKKKKKKKSKTKIKKNYKNGRTKNSFIDATSFLHLMNPVTDIVGELNCNYFSSPKKVTIKAHQLDYYQSTCNIYPDYFQTHPFTGILQSSQFIILA